MNRFEPFLIKLLHHTSMTSVEKIIKISPTLSKKIAEKENQQTDGRKISKPSSLMGVCEDLANKTNSLSFPK